VLGDPTLALAAIDRRVALVASELSARLRGRADALVERLTSATGVVLEPASPDVTLSIDVMMPGFSRAQATTGFGDKLLRAAALVPQGASVGGGAAVAMATVLSATNPVGWLAFGAALGAAQILRGEMRRLRAEEREANRAEVSRIAGAYVEECLNQVGAGMDWSLGQIEDAIVVAMTNALHHEQKRLNEELAALAAGRRRDAGAAAARQAELRAPLADLQDLRDEADSLAATIRNRIQGASVFPLVASAPANEGDGER